MWSRPCTLTTTCNCNFKRSCRVRNKYTPRIVKDTNAKKHPRSGAEEHKHCKRNPPLPSETQVSPAPQAPHTPFSQEGHLISFSDFFLHVFFRQNTPLSYLWQPSVKHILQLSVSFGTLQNLHLLVSQLSSFDGRRRPAFLQKRLATWKVELLNFKDKLLCWVDGRRLLNQDFLMSMKSAEKCYKLLFFSGLMVVTS